MANEEHLKVLMQGVDQWNAWRRNHVITSPDLSFAKLDNLKLENINLNLADLRGTDFTWSRLRHANLVRARLDNAILFHTKLEGAALDSAFLRSANLRIAALGGSSLARANLTGADLTEAYLDRVDFRWAIVHGADFTRSIIGETIFGSIDLSEAKGLDLVRHNGPSDISISTIYKSKGKISQDFLRGAGVPDTFIEYLASLVKNPIEFYSCFISYANKDHELAERLYADLQSKGVRCWFAPEDLKIGDKIRDRIDESIRLRDKLLLILSEHSVASDWVEFEVESALEEEHTSRKNRTVLFPIRLDDTVMNSKRSWAALIRRTRSIGDFRAWKEHDAYRKAFDRLLRDLRADSTNEERA